MGKGVYVGGCQKDSESGLGGAVIFCFFVNSILVTTGNPEVWATDQAKVHRQAEERQNDTPPVMPEE